MMLSFGMLSLVGLSSTMPSGGCHLGFYLGGLSCGMLSKVVVMWDVNICGVVIWDVKEGGCDVGYYHFWGCHLRCCLLSGCHLGCYSGVSICDVVIWDFIICWIVIKDAILGLLSLMLTWGFFMWNVIIVWVVISDAI